MHIDRRILPRSDGSDDGTVLRLLHSLDFRIRHAHGGLFMRAVVEVQSRATCDQITRSSLAHSPTSTSWARRSLHRLSTTGLRFPISYIDEVESALRLDALMKLCVDEPGCVGLSAFTSCHHFTNSASLPPGDRKHVDQGHRPRTPRGLSRSRISSRAP